MLKRADIVRLREPDGYEPSAIRCPSCRLRRLPGFMLARVGATKVSVEDAPPNVSWPLVCGFCGYEDEFGLVANPVPSPLLVEVGR